MDPITVVAAGAAALFATKVMEEAGTQAGKGLSAAAGRFVIWLRGKGREDAETEAAMTMVQTAPADQLRVDLLAQVLAMRATREDAFAGQLRELVGEAQQAGDVRLTIGGAHIHGDVSGGHVVQIAGDHYGQLRDPQ